MTMANAKDRTTNDAVRDALEESDVDGTISLHGPQGAADDIIEWLYQDGWMIVPIKAGEELLEAQEV